MAKNIRIFQIAKDLNISHTEILTFLKKKGVEVASHMTPVDEDIQEMIQGEFRKERQDIDRFRKEQVRREIHQTRIDEQQKAQKKLNLLCGHFEGIDQRVIDNRNIEELSVGDYILSGGETAAMIVMDSIIRLLPGVLGNESSISEETFENGLLEYPQYTKPREWEGKSPPEVLFSGDHAKIKGWRLSQSEAITRRQRPDLWKKYLNKKNEKH